MLLFLDRNDTPYTPEKFFTEVILLRCCGAPGPVYSQFIHAAWSFARILLFLFFVFVVVMAFGDAYSVSTTNQLLATVVGGFIPFLFR
jgi:predicted permease